VHESSGLQKKSKNEQRKKKLASYVLKSSGRHEQCLSSAQNAHHGALQPWGLLWEAQGKGHSDKGECAKDKI
jgi:hypothetical protein